jgi:deoxyribose-phosphate aldolase
MVINVGALKGGERDSVQREIASLAAACHAGGAILKVILETALLTDELKRIACRLSMDGGADFVKTSTGFSTAGANAADVALMREAVGAGLGVKASGGIRTLEDFNRMVAAGASRVGASASVSIVEASTHAAVSEQEK